MLATLRYTTHSFLILIMIILLLLSSIEMRSDPYPYHDYPSSVLTCRNTLLLSLLLGLTWLFALLGASLPVQWINVILNCSQGFYILLYSVLANRGVRGQVGLICKYRFPLICFPLLCFPFLFCFPLLCFPPASSQSTTSR